MKEIVDKLSKELNIAPEEVSKTYKSYWKFIRTKIEELPLKDDLDEESFNKLRTNFNIPKLGKLYCTLDEYRIIKSIIEKVKNDKDKED